MFVSPAFAQATAPAGAAASLESFLPLILIFVVFYFLLIRPQQKRAKQHKEMLGQLRRGDRVVTAGGIIGTVNKLVSDTEVVVEIAEGVRVRVLRATIGEVLSKTEPVAAKDDTPEKPADQ
ncbi:MAG: preprotein translocase subunit YajC [Actinomycetota bacterium]